MNEKNRCQNGDGCGNKIYGYSIEKNEVQTFILRTSIKPRFSN